MGPEIMGQNKMIAIIDYGMGNLRSAAKAFELICDKVVVTNKAEDIKRADYLILPGVGAFKEGINNLRSSGLADLLNQEVVVGKKPILGICLGMQLMAEDSEEFGKNEGLGWLDAHVIGFKTDNLDFKVPHVGWNDIVHKADCPLFKGIKQNTDFYFVHSYYMRCGEDIAVAACEYGITFAAAVQKGNIFAVQFHPEKSQTAGLKLLENFINYL